MISSILLGACGNVGAQQGSLLVGPASGNTFGVEMVQVGEKLFFGIYTLQVKGTAIVRVTKAEMAVTPDGIKIDGIYGLRPSEKPGGIIGAAGGRDAWWIRPLLHPVREMVLDPTCPRVSHCQPADYSLPGDPRSQDWYILVAVHLTKPGHYRSKGLRLTYSVGGQEYEQTFDRLAVEASTGRL